MQQVLESLDFNDLLSFSDTNQHMASMARQIFRRKFAHKFVEIKSESNPYSDDKDRIYLRNVESARKVLQRFGQSIYRMKLNFRESFDISPSEMETMSKMVNLYCSETLKEIVINEEHNSFFSQIEKPFKSVEHVELTGYYKDLHSKSLNFKEMFPAMKRLSLPYTEFDSMDQMFQHFPNLMELRVHFYDMGMTRMMSENDIEQIVRVNPQIRSLQVHSASETFLRVASEALPNLEFLRIEPIWHQQASNFAEFHGADISFKNVKILEVKRPLSACHIEFERLEELRAMFALNRDFEWWLHFIKKNTYLKKFQSIEGRIDDYDILIFAHRGNLNLEEISITLAKDVEVKSLVELVTANPNTKKFCFKFDEEHSKRALKLSELRDEFKNTWKITHNSDSIELEKNHEDQTKNGDFDHIQ